MNAGGIVFTLMAVIGAFVYEGGNPAVLLQIGEFMVIVGAFFGMLLSSASPAALKGAFGVILGIAKPDPYNKKNYLELLKVIYDLSTKVRKDGILSLESIVDDPDLSPILQETTFFLKNKEAKNLLVDALRNIVTGIEVEKLEEMLDTNIESIEKEVSAPAKMVYILAESLPGMGIVAAVMGIILTMGALGGSIFEIGEHVAAALTGTMLGLLLCYGIFGPMAKYAEFKNEDFISYLNALKIGIIYIAKGDAPIIAMEAVRESIPPFARPEFQEAEDAVKGK